jgi:hypothetical protein
MTKKIFSSRIIPVSLFFALSVNVSAQNPVGMNSFFCCEGHNPCLHFTSQSDLDYHNCHTHGIGCSSNPSPNSNNTIKSPVGFGIIGALPAALVGGLFKGKDGKNMWAPAALGAYGFFSSLDLLATSKKRSKGANIAIAIIGGAATGAAIGMAEKSNNTATSPKPDNTLKDAGIGAGVMLLPAALMGGKNKGHKSSSFNRSRKPDFLSKMSFGLTGNGIGIVVRL